MGWRWRSEGKSNPKTHPRAVRFDHHGVRGADDWTVDGMSFAVVLPDGLPVTTPIAPVVGSLFPRLMMVVVPAMVTMGQGRRTQPESAEDQRQSTACGCGIPSIAHRFITTDATV